LVPLPEVPTAETEEEPYELKIDLKWIVVATLQLTGLILMMYASQMTHAWRI
jgi:hypothetical protein